MKIVFISNFLNQHQVPFCEEMLQVCDEFYFIATEKTQNDGYKKSVNTNYILNYYDNNERHMCDDLLIAADVVLFGACPAEMIERRMKYNKLSFLYSERMFKKGRWRRLIPAVRKKINNRILRFKDRQIYVLCAGAYFQKDLEVLGYPKEKCYRWGYFPETRQYKTDELFARKRRNNKVSLLWAGRMIEWKHPDLSIQVARNLKKKGYSFELNIIGSGYMEEKLDQMIRTYELSDCVHKLGEMTPEQVREWMEQSDIFLFTSDRKEGWGAVLNESMNSGCAVVVNEAIGSAPYLVCNNVNGLMYRSAKELQECVEKLLDDPKYRRNIGLAAYRTMVNLWNAKVAAQRMMVLIQELQIKGVCMKYNDGPCSLDHGKENMT